MTTSWSKAWSLDPGDRILRTRLHADYGGSGRGGIAPLGHHPGVLFFTAPESGLQHGYVDHWDGRVFHYAGEGQRGNQEFIKGNKAILLAEAAGKVIHGFAGTGGTVRYLGRFHLDASRPWYCTFAPETQGRAMRQVIMFRLVPESPKASPFLPRVNEQLHLGTVFRPLADYLPGMQAPPKPIDSRRRPLSSSDRALLEWWLAQRIAEAAVQPLSPFLDKPVFDVGYQVRQDVALCAVDDPEDGRRLVDRLKARILDLRQAATALDRPDAVKVITLDGPPSDPRFEPALRDKGIHLTWQNGPALPLLARVGRQ